MRTKLAPLAALLLASCFASGAQIASASGLKIQLTPGLPSIPLPLPGFSTISGRSSANLPVTPRSKAILCVHEGCEFDRQGRHVEAMQKFEAAVQADPSYDLALSNVVTAYLVNGKLQEGLTAGRYYIFRFANCPQYEEVVSMVASMQSELQRRAFAEQSTGLPVGQEASDYFAYQLVHAVRKWPTDAMPLKVFVATGKNVSHFRQSFRDDLLESFTEWANKSDHLISFTFVNDPKEANIECEWIDDPNQFPSHSGIEGGETVPYYNNGKLSHAKVILLTTSRTSSGKQPESAMRHVCLHEIGHSLGLLEHSDSPDDMMFYAFQGDDRTRPHLSTRDLRTLARLYAYHSIALLAPQQTRSEQPQQSQVLSVDVSSKPSK
jgi:hypothetical protein